MDLDWNSVNIDECLIEVAKKRLRFKQMNPVQKAVIPLLTNYKDILCEACTGSGKTIAFVVSILQILLKHHQQEPMDKFYIGALIISPTRELSVQTFQVIQEFLTHPRLSQFLTAKLFTGGNNLIADGEDFLNNGGNIFVVTPGRMVSLLENYPQIGYKLRKCLQILVIDETDVLLDMGFDKEVNEILSYLPKQRRTGLFSATQTKLLSRLIKLGLRNPVRVEIKEKKNIELKESQVEGEMEKESLSILKSTGLQISPYLQNNYVVLESSTYKISYILRFIKLFIEKKPHCKFLIFFATCTQVDLFSEVLEHHLGKTLIKVLKLHRKLKQKRQKIFEKFKKSKIGMVLLSTDVMSRGIDVPQIDWVVNFDLPNTLQDYIHRSGRSGHQLRKKGYSMVLCLPHEIDFVQLCQGKGMKFNERKIDSSCLKKKADSISEWLRQKARADAAFYTKTMKTFVSFVRTYISKNIMSSAFFKKIDLIDLANSYGLLNVPHMPELKGRLKNCPSKLAVRETDRDIVMEHKNLLRSQKGPETEPQRSKPLKITEQRERMKELIESTKLKGKKKKKFIDQVEFDELAEDARMVKKLKKGLISQEDFDEHFGLD
ncbi:ATP-dependent RNA helicase DDX55-like [Brevipalpus obovatus]|uniref:ATP-dependent RNA helicase DDX55-like n=1 Tax=Brevipalpus obovatus TaxID=246614 RepID=UPI003D9E5756